MSLVVRLSIRRSIHGCGQGDGRPLTILLEVDKHSEKKEDFD